MEPDNMMLDADHQKVMYPVPPKVKQSAYIGHSEYMKMYEESISSPDTFWGKMASEHLAWFRPFTKVRSGTFTDGDIAWFLDGELNVSYNCLDRHLASKRDQVAIIWEGDYPNDVRKITYFQLFQEVCRLSNVLLSLGLRKGDSVAIYLPNCPEAAFSMLACARIGVIHSVVFAGFSAESLSDRIIDAKSKCVITADQFSRGGRAIFLKKIVDEALLKCNSVQHVLVLQRAKNPDTSNWVANRDIDFYQAMSQQRPYCPAVSMNSEDPLFLLYTSGSTGKPKGLLHTQAGYLLNAALTHRYVFDYHPGDVYACVADVGWITGHSYIVYGPLCNGATTLMFEGLPTLPDAGRYWDMVQRHKITQFYTAPTAIRTLMKFGNELVKKYDRSSLRILGSVGEPINPEAWKWYYDVVGDGQCAIVDTYWQTESGAHLLTPLPGAITTKAGSATVPFFGIKPEVLDSTTGQILQGNNVSGVLAIATPWPSIARTIYNSHDRYLTTYMKPYQGYYFTGDGVERDQDGYYWISGRVDDVVNVSGHRLGTAELESALVASPACAEAAVIGVPHDVKGQAIFAYCILKDGYEDSVDMVQSLKMEIRKRIGPFAAPDYLLIVPALPKTRSGKIMRRVLRKIACNETKPEQLGDISTLADPSIVPTLIQLVEEMQQEIKVLDAISQEHKKHKAN